MWSPGEAKNHRPQNAFKLQKISPQILLLFALFVQSAKGPNHDLYVGFWKWHSHDRPLVLY